MARPPPQPVFVHHGFSGGVTACDVIDLEEQRCILVGTLKGECGAYDLRTHQLVRKVYEDPEGRSVANVGNLEGIIWIHLRNYALLFFYNGSITPTTIELSHYGYCRCVALNSTLIYPDTEVC
uniref:MMS1_N domain-containing protein n=1 Tax=Heterorhabditis bacteriophora TaxID=37862 RepID=A0A1I7XKX0_HETBA